ncbi:hypothetical protein RJT34_15835 [Clitoria ternatea]|uniref:Uncharacterized protein n=1 Tax=Clitoria ternatea TaxID=43366 RepID=A0AAN9J7C2_CLITE
MCTFHLTFVLVSYITLSFLPFHACFESKPTKTNTLFLPLRLSTAEERTLLVLLLLHFLSLEPEPSIFSLSSADNIFFFFFSESRRVVGAAAVVVPAMGQQSLIYSFVARGTVILAEYTEFTGNFTGVAAQCLQKLPSSNNKFTYNCDGHTFNYLVDNGFTYCVVAVESAGRQIPIAFLERVKEEFTKKYAGGKAATAAANSLNKEFGSKLKEQMQYCVDHPEEISKIAKVKAQVSEVKGVMMENIEKVLDRGEKIELLVDKTENLRSQAQDFRQQGTKIRRKMWFQNMKIKLIVLGIIIALILIIVLSICGGFHCGK